MSLLIVSLGLAYLVVVVVVTNEGWPSWWWLKPLEMILLVPLLGLAFLAVAREYARGRQDWAVILYLATIAALVALYWLTVIFIPGLAPVLGLVEIVVLFLLHIMMLVLWLGRKLARPVGLEQTEEERQWEKSLGKVLKYPPRSKRK